MPLPNALDAIVSREKIVDYLLNPEHPDGGGKASFFAAAGFDAGQWQDLAVQFLQLAQSPSSPDIVDSVHGRKYILEGEIDTPARGRVAVRTVWIVDQGDDRPRLVTAYPRKRQD